MEPNQQVDAPVELVTESLVDEVSIDGMCGSTDHPPGSSTTKARSNDVPR
jgi:mycofactocin precursor